MSLTCAPSPPPPFRCAGHGESPPPWHVATRVGSSSSMGDVTRRRAPVGTLRRVRVDDHSSSAAPPPQHTHTRRPSRGSTSTAPSTSRPSPFGASPSFLSPSAPPWCVPLKKHLAHWSHHAGTMPSLDLAVPRGLPVMRRSPSSTASVSPRGARSWPRAGPSYDGAQRGTAQGNSRSQC